MMGGGGLSIFLNLTSILVCGCADVCVRIYMYVCARVKMHAGVEGAS